jgi:hypothetical protein
MSVGVMKDYKLKLRQRSEVTKTCLRDHEITMLITRC